MPTTALYRSLKILGSPLLTGLYHHEVVGLENLPEGPFIVASNHLAFCDSIFIPLALPRTVNFLAKSDYFTTPGLKGRAMAAFFRGVGQLPIEEYTADVEISYRSQREVADTIGTAIRTLSGQEYVDVYADRVKKLMADEHLSADEAVARLQNEKR